MNYRDRDYKIITPQDLAEDVVPTDEDPVEILFESITDLLQLAEAEGIYEDEIDLVLQRVIHDRAVRKRNRTQH